MKVAFLLIFLIGVISSHELNAFPSHNAEHCPDDSSNESPLAQDDLDVFNDGTPDDEAEVDYAQVERAQGSANIRAEVVQKEKESCRATLSADEFPFKASKCPKFDWSKCKNKGLTWKVREHYCPSGLNRVACAGCNPYYGDTWCWYAKRILCIYKAQDVRPDYPISGPGYAMPVEFYHGWTGGHIKATSKYYRGCFIFSKKHADYLCYKEFGKGWMMASHHDGRYMPGMGGSTNAYASWNWAASYGGGWQWYAYGAFDASDEKFWTYINDQPGNCWN